VGAQRIRWAVYEIELFACCPERSMRDDHTSVIN
jgi:hypothetical protein